ncbi:MAG: VOC family protein [Deltaproteobacteria bacterium]|nr:VOC family protein [Deltaproteobacteria bacterium]
MRLHHLAVLGPDPAALAAFYAAMLGLPELRRAHDDSGVRAVWLDADGVILMFERGPRGQNGVIVFASRPGTAGEWRARLGPHHDGRSDYTLYGRDPDGNRFGVSSFPDPIGPEG